MKVILFVLFFQMPPQGVEAAPVVMAGVSAEFDSAEACLNAIKGVKHVANLAGVAVNAVCVPKAIAKLDVVPKGKGV